MPWQIIVLQPQSDRIINDQLVSGVHHRILSASPEEYHFILKSLGLMNCGNCDNIIISAAGYCGRRFFVCTSFHHSFQIMERKQGRRHGRSLFIQKVKIRFFAFSEFFVKTVIKRNLIQNITQRFFCDFLKM